MCSQKPNVLFGSTVLIIIMGKKLSKLDQCCAIIVHMWFMAVFVRNLIRSDQAHQYHNKIIFMMDCHYRAHRVDLWICDWNSETFSAVPPPTFEKTWYLSHLKFLARIGTSSGLEITTWPVEARKRKLIEDFTGIQWNGSKFAAHRSISGIILFLIIQK